MAYKKSNPNGSATMANSEPVVIASDQTSIPVAATLTAETTKVIGVTRTADGAGNLLTSTTNALDVNLKTSSITLPVSLATNTPTLQAGSTTTVTQATGTNLHTVVDSGAVTATLSAETTKVIGTVNQGTSPWVTSNATTSVVGNGAAATAQRVTLANDSTGIIATVGAVTAITNALPVGANVIGKVSIDQTTPGTTNKISISDSLGGSIFNTPYGRQQVELNPHQIFYDPFDTALDTTDRWTTPTVGNSAVTAVTSVGSMSLGTGTTASGWSKLTSQASFMPTVPGWIGFSFLNLFPDLAAPTANSYRFWGMGTIAAVPTTAAPMTDAAGFEISTAGKMFAVVYTAGTRTAVQDLSAATGNATQPTDALLHRYIVKYRTDRIYFYIDGESSAQLVATYSGTTATSGPSVQTLPISFLAVGGATPPVSNTQIISQGAVVWDASQNNNTLSDGSFQWRKATIKKASTAATATDTSLVVALNPTSPIVPGVAATNLGKAEDAAHASGDTGVFMLAVRNDNGATSFGQDQDYAPMAVDAGGRAIVTQKAPTGTLSNVASSATSVTLLAANVARQGATIYNDSTQVLYAKFGATASATSFTVLMVAAAYYEVPFGYTGIIDGIWASANGNARVTEIT